MAFVATKALNASELKCTEMFCDFMIEIFNSKGNFWFSFSFTRIFFL